MSTPPPGWYPDPSGQGTRWWTGRDWGPVAPPATPIGIVQPPLPAATTTTTVWAILQAVLPLPLVLAVLPYLLSFQGYFSAIVSLQRDGAPGGAPSRADQAQLIAAFGPVIGATGVAGALQLLVFAAWVVFAFLDVRELRRRGLVQPFPWPWAFLSLVYPIGRAVVVRRRVRGSLAPLWVLIGTYVASIALQIVLMFVLFAGFFQQMASLSSQLPTS